MRRPTQRIGSLIISLFPKREVQGIRVVFTDINVDRGECSARLHRAIALVRATGKQYESLMKRVRYVVVWPGQSTFADDSGGVHIASEDLMGIDDLALASVLVHEAAHHRIKGRGIASSSENHDRVERLCVKVQAQFLRQNPWPGPEMATEAEQVLSRPWWTPEQLNAELDEYIAAHRLPRWLKAVLKRQ